MAKIALAISDFNYEITSKMEKYAEKTAVQLKTGIIRKTHVPGTFEIPFAARGLFKDKKADAVVALGVVIQGDTYHDVIIMNSVSERLMELSLEYNKPLGFGIIGPRVTWQQAEKRATEYAERAVRTAVGMVELKYNA